METESRNDVTADVLARIEGDPVELRDWLLASAGSDGERREEVADVISAAARQLAPADEPPSDGASAAAWQALVETADLLFGSGVHELGRLPFVGDRLLGALKAEAREQRPGEAETDRRAAAGAGDVLAGLAVSRQLREAVGDGLGFAVSPTYQAVYMYDPPGSHVRTHVDARGYEIVLHQVLEHTLPPDGSGGSALVVHRLGEREPTRLRLKPGEAVVLRGRGTIHSWEALRDGERRTLTAVGFERAPSAAQPAS